MERFTMKRNDDSGNTANDRSPLMLKVVMSYSVFLFVIMILFFYNFTTISKNARSQYDLQMRSNMMSNVELFEKDLDIMKVYCRQLMQNDRFRRLTQMNADDSSLNDYGYSLSTMLSTDVYPESLLPIAEVFCYLPNSGYILAPSYFITQERYYGWIKKYNESEHESWLEMLENEENYYKFIPLNRYISNNYKYYYIYMIHLGDLSYMDIPGVVCFVMERDELSSLFDTLGLKSDYSYLSVVSGGGERLLSIAHTDREAAEDTEFDYTDTTFGDSITGGIIPNPEKYLKPLRINISGYTSPDSDYTYYYSYPAYEAAFSISQRRIVFLLLFIVALFLGVVLVILFSRRNIMPILQLDEKLKEANEQKESLEEEKNTLQEVVDRQRPIICSSYIRKLLEGNIGSDSEAEYVRSYLGINGDNLYYSGLYIVTYNNPNNNPNDSGDSYSDEAAFSGGNPISDEATFSGGNSISDEAPLPASNPDSIVMDALNSFFGEPFYCYNPGDRTYALLLSCSKEEKENFVVATNEIIIRLHDYMLDTYGIWLFAGLGSATDSLIHVWESYQQAIEAVSYTSKNYIFYPYEFIKKDSRAFYYPAELSTKLIHFITTGNTAQVMETFNLLHHENIEARSLPFNMLRFLLSDIRNTLLKARFALPANIAPEDTAKIDACFEQHTSFKLCEDIALALCKLFTVEPDDSSLIATIEKYISSNYSDPSMGLNRISDKFQISESYFSHMFKEKTGVNFSTYLENIRMKEAARLIKETDTGLNELYISVGYNNANTFRRAFKKVYGITPSMMREKKET